MRMQLPWNPPMPLEALFKQLEEGITFAAGGGEASSDTQVIPIGYNIISTTGLLETKSNARQNNGSLPRPFLSR
jgi:hypothetical protein